jgi:hypothetical protein
MVQNWFNFNSATATEKWNKNVYQSKKKLNRYLQANADPDQDPLFHFYADPDPHPHQSDANLRPLGIRTLDGSVVSLYSS